MAAFIYLASNALEGLKGFAPIILIIIVFYLFLIQPGRKRQKQWQAMLSKLKPGDRVTTTGGLRGKVIAVREDIVRLGVDPENTKLEVAKSAIATVSTSDGDAK
jgi:preprotein translocase subunit YajC